jgi:large subunit ribosomal protein L32
MAVPKKKQSHSRTNKRRSQYKAAVPTYNACPQCHSPRLPHRVCPECGYYGGRQVVAERTSRGGSRATSGEAAPSQESE